LAAWASAVAAAVLAADPPSQRTVANQVGYPYRKFALRSRRELRAIGGMAARRCDRESGAAIGADAARLLGPNENDGIWVLLA
jgi:hypothetical protein